jgi:hypothetical protein
MGADALFGRRAARPGPEEMTLENAMYLKGITTAALAALLTTGCGYRIKTATDYNHSVRFSGYDTFFFLKGNSSGNLLLDQRVTADVEAALTSKGWVEVPPGEGRAAVVVHAATQAKHSYATFYDGWGGWQWRWRGAGSSTTFVQDYKVGAVVVDIFDADTKEAIWRGSASDALSGNPKDKSKATERAVAKMFNKFPPPQ